jgi:hypothetical protein
MARIIGTQIFNLCGERSFYSDEFETPDMDVGWPHRQHAVFRSAHSSVPIREIRGQEFLAG